VSGGFDPAVGAETGTVTVSDRTVPRWLQRTGAISWRLMAIAALGAVLVWAAFVLGTVTASIVLSLILAAAFGPLVRRLRARGWSETSAAAAVTGVIFLLAVGALAILLLEVIPSMATMVREIRTGVDQLRDQLADTVTPEVAASAAQVAQGIQSWIGSQIAQIAGSIGAVATIAILTLFLTFFVLQDGEKAWAWLLQGTSAPKRDGIETSGRDALERVGGYLRGTALLSAVIAAAYGAFLWILGGPASLPLAIVVIGCGFIPYVGRIVAVGAVLLVGLGAIGPEGTLVLLVLVVVATILVGRLMGPIVHRKSIHLHPAIVLVALPVGAALAGIFGLIVAVPVTAFAMAVGGAVIDAIEPDPTPEPRREVSGWVDRLAQWSWRLLAAMIVSAAALFLIAQAPVVVIPLVLAAVIAATCAPLVGSLSSRGWGASRAALLVTGGAYLLILAVVVVAIVQLAGPISSAIGSSIAGAQSLDDGASGKLGAVVELAETFGGELLRAVATVLGATAVVGIMLVLAALLSFYFLRDGPRGWDLVLRRASPWRRDSLGVAGSQAVTMLGGYMLGTAAISAVGAISQLLIMVILGIPFAVPVAILSFIACFIPYIGGFITTGLAFLLTVAVGDQADIVIMFVYTIVINIVQGNIVTPLVYKRAVNLHPAIVLLAIPAGGAVAGIAGMFLAVPLLAVVSTTWRTVLRVLGDEPAPRASREVEPGAANPPERGIDAAMQPATD
jgi:putative heme transporter